MSLQSSYTHFETKAADALDWLKGETRGLRTGRVKPDLLEGIFVEQYGTQTPLKGVASISNSDARTIVISPWDPSVIPSIKKSITQADLGVQPIEDGRVIRLSFPSLTEELREQTIKMLHKKAEEGRIRLRRSRDEALEILKKDKSAGDITEDDFYEGKEHLDELIDKANDSIADLIKRKEEEIRTV